MTVKTSWQADRATLDEIDLILTEIADPPVDATSLARLDDGSQEDTAAPWVLHAYTEDEITQPILALLPTQAGTPITEVLEERDWVAHALEGLGMVRAGRFVLFGRHDKDKISADDAFPIQVEANQAFGTGHHPTTSGCLEALTPLEALPVSSVLDVGTGSGVLAMAARRLWPGASIVAADIDPTSVKIANENAAVNNIKDITFETAAGTDHPTIQAHQPYDLVFANILAGPLKELAPDLVAATAPGGHLILAGLLDEQKAEVEEAYTDRGMSLLSVGGTNRWPTLTLKR